MALISSPTELLIHPDESGRMLSLQIVNSFPYTKPWNERSEERTDGLYLGNSRRSDIRSLRLRACIDAERCELLINIPRSV